MVENRLCLRDTAPRLVRVPDLFCFSRPHLPTLDDPRPQACFARAPRSIVRPCLVVATLAVLHTSLHLGPLLVTVISRPIRVAVSVVDPYPLVKEKERVVPRRFFDRRNVDRLVRDPVPLGQRRTRRSPPPSSSVVRTEVSGSLRSAAERDVMTKVVRPVVDDHRAQSVQVASRSGRRGQPRRGRDRSRVVAEGRKVEELWKSHLTRVLDRSRITVMCRSVDMYQEDLWSLTDQVCVSDTPSTRRLRERDSLERC